MPMYVIGQWQEVCCRKKLVSSRNREELLAMVGMDVNIFSAISFFFAAGTPWIMKSLLSLKVFFCDVKTRCPLNLRKKYPPVQCSMQPNEW
jgi:hypothetical protein